MSENVKDYGQLFCEAVDTIVKERLSNIKFDNTILCTVVDIKDKAQGKYMVAYSEAKFEAYAKGEDVYKKNDKVYVQIPGGDWNEQKFIMAKKTSDEEMKAAYKDPFDNFVDITGNIIINTPKVEGELVANGKWDDEEDKFINGSDDKIIWAYNITDKTIKNREEGEEFSKYTRLGIQAQFRSWLAEDRTVSGSYGLKLRVKAEMADEEDQKKDSEENNTETAAEDSQNKIIYYDFILDAIDMFGNPYAYDTYFQQEKIFNISDIYRIKEMQLQFYQKGDFKNQIGEMIPVYEDWNLFVKDVYISLGYDIEEFENDTAVIYSLGSPKYDVIEPLENNHRKINIRWIHKMSEDKIKSIDINDKISYKITFYKYRLGAFSATPQSGVDWVPLSEQIVQWNDDYTEKTVTINILDQEWKDYNATASAGYVRTPDFNYTWLIPDPTLAEESVKAIISYEIDEQQVYVYSDSLTFSNREEVVSKPTVDAVSALTIVCEDNSFGNYRIYGQGGDLLNSKEGATERLFKAYFKGAPLESAESIEWIIPTENTMIILEDGYYSKERTWDSDDRAHIIRRGNKAKKWDIKNSNTQSYKIRGNYAQVYANNTIQCKVIKDKITYTAAKELTFGPAGTSGSDYTLILDFDDGITGIPYFGPQTESNPLWKKENNTWILNSDTVKMDLNPDGFGITARLYNFENEEIDFEKDISNYTLDWDFSLYSEKSDKKALVIDKLKKGKKKIRKYNEETGQEEFTYVEDSTGRKKFLEVNYDKLEMDNLYIIQATFKWRGAEEGKDQEVLTAYLPVPIYRYLVGEKDDEGNDLIIQPAFIGGAKQVIYMSNGYPNYYKDAYQIFYNEYNELEDKTIVKKKTAEWTGDNIAWYLIPGKDGFDDYSPSYGEVANEVGNLKQYKNCLKPCSIYVEGANPYGVQCKRKKSDSAEYESIWTQPIFVTMNRYPNAMVNKWDGKTLTLDEQNGAILATAIAAGRKESDKSFTGVMIGDWAEAADVESSLSKTGVYGFNHGAQSFAFTEDGKAFIGKSGRGRIYLDGDDSLIYSHSWTQENQEGMCLDLDDGKIQMKRPSNFRKATASEKNTIKTYINNNSNPPKDNTLRGDAEDIKASLQIITSTQKEIDTLQGEIDTLQGEIADLQKQEGSQDLIKEKQEAIVDKQEAIALKQENIQNHWTNIHTLNSKYYVKEQYWRVEESFISKNENEVYYTPDSFEQIDLNKDNYIPNKYYKFNDKESVFYKYYFTNNNSINLETGGNVSQVASSGGRACAASSYISITPKYELVSSDEIETNVGKTATASTNPRPDYYKFERSTLAELKEKTKEELDKQCKLTNTQKDLFYTNYFENEEVIVGGQYYYLDAKETTLTNLKEITDNNKDNLLKTLEDGKKILNPDINIYENKQEYKLIDSAQKLTDIYGSRSKALKAVLYKKINIFTSFNFTGKQDSFPLDTSGSGGNGPSNTSAYSYSIYCYADNGTYLGAWVDDKCIKGSEKTYPLQRGNGDTQGKVNIFNNRIDVILSKEKTVEKIKIVIFSNNGTTKKLEDIIINATIDKKTEDLVGWEREMVYDLLTDDWKNDYQKIAIYQPISFKTYSDGDPYKYVDIFNLCGSTANLNGYISLSIITANGVPVQYDRLLDYYLKESSADGVDGYYVTLSVAESSIPLAIGTSSSLRSRNFYVEWDGTLHAKNGEFSGHVEATTGRLGDLEVYGTLKGGRIEGSYIEGVEIHGSNIYGSNIFFGEGAGYKYDIYSSSGEYLYSRTYAQKLTNSSYNGNSYVYCGEVDGTNAGSLRLETGDDYVGVTSVLALSAINTAFPIVVRADDRVLVRSANSWAALQAGDGKNKIEVQPDGTITISGPNKILIKGGDIELDGSSVKFSGAAANASNQTNIYAKFAGE